MITRTNYEIFFIDYFDGKLNQQTVKELNYFLNNNPDLRKEFNDFELINLKPKTIIFEHKDSLKKSNSLTYSQDDFEKKCIAHLEGDMSTKEANDFNIILSESNDLANVYHLFEKTRFIPDFEIKYPAKNALKKTLQSKRRKLIYIFTAISSAAAVLLFFYLLNKNNDNFIKEPVAESFINKTKNPADNKEIDGKVKDQSIDKVTKIIDVQDITIIHNEKLIPAPNIEKVENKIHSDNQLIEDNILRNENPKNDLADNQVTSLKNDSIINITIIALNDSIGNVNKSKNLTTIQPFRLNEDYMGIKDFISTKIAERVLTHEEQKNRSFIKFWDIAALAINAYGKFTGKDLQLKKTYNKDGKLEYLVYESELISFSKKFK